MARVGASVTSITLSPASRNRQMLVIHNDSRAILYVKLGADASAIDFTYRLVPQAVLELPLIEDGKVYQGLVSGIWDANNGFAYVTDYGRNAV
jgi:hypothetical protein